MCGALARHGANNRCGIHRLPRGTLALNQPQNKTGLSGCWPRMTEDLKLSSGRIEDPHFGFSKEGAVLVTRGTKKI